MGPYNYRRCIQFLVCLGIFIMPSCWGFTDPDDVIAMNRFYAALGFPPLVGWEPVGGDPCGMSWQGVACVNANVTAIMLNGVNLSAVLPEDISYFASMLQIDLGSNHIGGPIPSSLPLTLQMLTLSGNQFTGSIPPTVSLLIQLTDFQVAKNQLEGAIPDSFQQLKALANMDLSGNKLTGELPSSMGNMSSLTKLTLKDNQLSGNLDVLQDLPLTYLDVENNLFSGPIPEKLLTIPNFRKGGNPFNTSVLPSPLGSSPSLSPIRASPPALAPEFQAAAPEIVLLPNVRTNVKSHHRVTWMAIIVLIAVIVIALAACLLLSRYCKKKQVAEKTVKGHAPYAYGGSRANTIVDDSLHKPQYETRKVRKKTFSSSFDGVDAMKLTVVSQEKCGKSRSVLSKKEDHKIDIAGLDPSTVPSLPPHFPLVSCGRVTSDSVVTRRTSSNNQAAKIASSVQVFSIASLQQCTNSFSHENFVGKGILGSVYKAKLLNGKLGAVKKLDLPVQTEQSEQDFLNLVAQLSTLQHAHVVKLVGYCSEHKQRLLVYEYCTNGTLSEALHVDDDIHVRLSWNARVGLGLQAAKALEYLHEVCQPPVVHKNFKSANILLEDDLSVRVSDCGFAPLLSENSMAQLQTNGYGAPELETGSYTCQSDVYSFGVVMLELLTGRKAFDRSRARGEQNLVRWAIPQLHDIDALSRMVDPSLNGVYPTKSLSRFADIISLCTQPEPEFRPPMSEIVQSLLYMVPKDTSSKR